MKCLVLAFTLLFSSLSASVLAEDLFPRAASLKRSEVYVRSGPGTRYPILWVFQRKGWPVSILNKYDNWFKIRDIEGEEGWVYVGMVSGQKTGIISAGAPALLSKKPAGVAPIYRLAPHVIVQVEDCAQESELCRVSYNGKIGHIDPARVLQPNVKQ